ncbi:MAG: hypothetical protein HZB67_00945 [Candidatus Aenigmarchaeota archaeon]|nr:hypothetical protein [Candidatus Aenigmarchaeota archaeon]
MKVEYMRPALLLGIILAFTIVASTTIVLAEVPQVEWSKTYGGDGYDYAYSVQQITDGGYITCGNTLSFGAVSYEFYLVRTDAQGNMIWNKTFRGVNGAGCSVVQQTSDGGYIAEGWTNNSANTLVVKTDSNGNMLWNGTYNMSGPYFFSYLIQQTSDGKYIFVAGDKFVETDSNGNILSNGPTTQNYDSTLSQQTSDGGRITAGTSSYARHPYLDALLTKTNSQGNTSWNKTYNFGGIYGCCANNYVTSVKQTLDGGYILIGNTYGTGSMDGDFWLVKTDSQGNTLWNKTFTHTVNYSVRQGIEGYSVQQTSDGGYVVAGDEYRYGGVIYTYDVLLMKLSGENNCNINLVNTSWSSWSNVGNCTAQDEQNQSRYKTQYDANNCGVLQNQTFYEYQNQKCDFCTPNWIANSICSANDSLNVWYNDSNSCFSQTNLSSDLQGIPDNQTIPFSCDYNGDGFIGNLSDVNTTLSNLTIENNNNTLEFKDGDNIIVEFEFYPTNGSINLANLTIEKQSNTSNKGYMTIRGIPLSENKTKTVYMDNIANLGSICVKDSEIASISEISSACNGASEVFIVCNGNSFGGYTCSNLGDKYKINGLLHSGVQEYAPYCGDGSCNNGETCSSCSQDCGTCPPPKQTTSGGGGLASPTCTENWNCMSWSDCINGMQNRTCVDSDSCGTTKNRPSLSQPCSIPVLNRTSENQTTSQIPTQQTPEQPSKSSIATENQTATNPITGMLTSPGNYLIFGICVMIIFIIVVIILFRKKFSGKKKER